MSQNLSFLDRVPHIAAYQNGENTMQNTTQLNNFVEPNLEMTAVSLNNGHYYQSRQKPDTQYSRNSSEGNSNSRLGTQTGGKGTNTMNSKENSELCSLKNTQPLFKQGKV